MATPSRLQTFLLTLLLTSTAHAQTTRHLPKPPAPNPAPNRPLTTSNFLRYVEDTTHPRLEVSIVTLSAPNGFTVDLVSAVHVADQAYFDALNQRFKTYDAVLYELVKPEGFTLPPPGQKVETGSPVSFFQRFLTSTLNLAFQLDAIDYSPKNFVHADMTAEQFEQRQSERGESLMGLMLQAMLSDATTPPTPGQAPPPDAMQLLWASQQPDAPRQFKLLLAKAFGDIEQRLAGLQGPKGSVLLTERNDAALAVLRKTRKDPTKKRLALFYGAAHMPDLAKKLSSIDRLKITKTEWVTAWDLTAEPNVAKPTTQPHR